MITTSRCEHSVVEEIDRENGIVVVGFWPPMPCYFDRFDLHSSVNFKMITKQ